MGIFKNVKVVKFDEHRKSYILKHDTAIPRFAKGITIA